MTLFVDEIMHGVVAAPFAVLLWYRSRSWRQLVVFYLVVYFIDLDHLVDYWLFYGLRFNWHEFVSLDFFAQKATAYLPLHAWEWTLILYPLSIKRGWKSLFAAINSGMFAHLVWDIHNFWNIEFYSIIYRAIHSFSF